MQAPIQEETDRLIIRWFPETPVVEIVRIMQKAAVRMGEIGITTCEVWIGVDRNQTLADWRIFLAALEPILVSGIHIQFKCEKEQTAEWLRHLGLYLVGPVGESKTIEQEGGE